MWWNQYSLGAVLLGVLCVCVAQRAYGAASERKKDVACAWKKDRDPAVSSDVNPVLWRLAAVPYYVMSFFPRTVVNGLFPPDKHLTYYDLTKYPGVASKVSVTVDDCFCRQSDPSKSWSRKVRALFKKYDAKGTFFLTLKYSEGKWREREIRSFVEDGHELANHCKDDREYDEDPPESFEADFDETNKFILRMSGKKSCKWFRAPSGKCSDAMLSVLRKRGAVHVMLDAYGNDPHCPDAGFIARTILRCVRSGSIIVLHFPEEGFREWCFDAIEMVLSGLRERGLNSVTLSELERAAMGT